MPISCGNNDCLDRSVYLPVDEGKFRRYEQLGLRVRSFLGLGIHDRLYPHKLAEILGIKVMTLSEIDGVSEEVRNILADSSKQWSGGATPMLPDGTHIVILNPWQSNERQAVTLMEEICHILLGHQHSQIATDVITISEDHRSYHEINEEEAYAVGAAALVPYQSLKCDLSSGRSIRLIANYFGVTTSLIKYRIRVLKLISVMSRSILTTKTHKTHYRTQ